MATVRFYRWPFNKNPCITGVQGAINTFKILLEEVMNIDNEIKKHFPYNTFRKFQIETMKETIKAFESGVDNVIIESPCGSGKSAMAICLGRIYRPAFLLTSQKILQEQYIKDYVAGDMMCVKGRGNYDCYKYTDQRCDTCDAGVVKCSYIGLCEYNIAKSNAAVADIALMNYSYFLHATTHGETFSKRNIIIYDEAHTIDSELMSFVLLKLSNELFKYFGLTIKIPVYETIDEYLEWLKLIKLTLDSLLIKISSHYENTFDSVKKYNLRKDMKTLTDIISKMSNIIANTGSEWVFNISGEYENKEIEFKPIFISSFSNQYLFSYSNKNLFMSATILSGRNFCSNIGLDFDKTEFFKVPTTFPVSNRKTYLMDTGSMGYKNINETVPAIIRDVGQIMDKHGNEKGLIYTHTYKISEQICNGVSRVNKMRLMPHESSTRDIVISRFMSDESNSVLISPSISDGVDLKDDLARFIIITKIPYAFIGDAQIKARMERDRQWYVWKTALKLVQIMGRGIRHEKDYCSIYILDSDIENFINNNRKLFPDYILKSIIKEESNEILDQCHYL